MSSRGRVRTGVSAVVAMSLVGVGWVSAVASGPQPGRAPTNAVAAVAVPPHTFTVSDEITSDAIAAAAVSTVSGCGAPASTPVPDGKPIVVRIPPAKAFTVGKISSSMWRRPPVSDPAWQLEFYGFMWLPALAQRAADDGQSKSLGVLVDQLVSFHRLDPDPRKSLRGWDEGASLRRLSAENCLYNLTGSKRLISGMKADANVLLGSRYYGPPYNAVHNHGLMANLALLKAGSLLKVSAWRSTAVRRMRSESVLAFSSKGTSFEQSSSYHRVNISLWNQAAHALDELAPGDKAARTIRQVTAKAMRVYAWMTEPDGKIVMVGDSDESVGATRSKATDRILRDDQAGWGFGRWSWTDPRTTYYTVRYGPATRAHGQPDRGGVTWSTLGARVLVGPGRFTYHSTSKFHGYSRSAASHNVAFPTRGKLTNGRPAAVKKLTSTSTKQAWQLSDGLYGVVHARALVVDARAHRLTVTDSFGRRTSFVQKWHLDTAWRLSSLRNHGRTAVFTRADGRRLVIATGGGISVVRGSTRPVAGWYFPSLNHRSAAYEITVSARGTTTTTFTLS